ncbi:MAG: hypothetical protein AB8A49_06185 [Prochlorococcus sp.]|mgnify:CR=1 FL=1|jgi:uncharacterized protein YceH (UPF0502 family)|nr:hypothetical protein [Prochlorococcaceae cyanobacterium ETNP14_MAG_5]MDP6851483.1 hypothetical protein [Prochlorococcaceae cyanobacterium ETNP1_MAG_8]|tara:strand:- start:1708 stop:2019 length:312 start_codon:yes stop_codon:yes gene_type:complete
MSSPDSLLRATLNRLAARLSHGLADAAVGLAALAQDAPERLSNEWDLFQQEVIAEADRLEQEIDQAEEVKASSSVQASESAQAQIDRLRAKVADLNRKVEVKH